MSQPKNTAPDVSYLMMVDDPDRRRALKQLGIGTAGLWLTACVAPGATNEGSGCIRLAGTVDRGRTRSGLVAGYGTEPVR